VFILVSDMAVVIVEVSREIETSWLVRSAELPLLYTGVL